jgi:mono/diheme cytochrome c family protein
MRLFAVVSAWILFSGVPVMKMAAATPSEATFYKDALPIFQAKCAACHRPGQVAPMSLLSYSTTRPWAKAIKAAVLSKKMPPGQGFSGDRFQHQLETTTLSTAETQTLVAWVDGGAQKGNEKDAPAPVAFNKDGWTIRPDIVIDSGREFDIPAEGVIPWMDYVLPYKFDKDVYVAATEMIPSDPEHTHHYLVSVVPPGPEADKLDNWDIRKPVPNRSMGSFGANSGAGKKRPEDAVASAGDVSDLSTNSAGYLMAWDPGQPPQRYDHNQSAMFVKAGSRLLLNVHYTTNGKPGRDHARAAIEIYPGVPTQVTYMMPEPDSPQMRPFALPPGASNFEVSLHQVFEKDATIGWIQPHMHLRGKDMKYVLTYPDGKQEVLLDVPNYSFNWQLIYTPDQPISIPAGTRIDVISHFDNSANNKNNPDPTATVIWGQQAWQEMCNAILFISVPNGIKPKEVVRVAKDVAQN